MIRVRNENLKTPKKSRSELTKLASSDGYDPFAVSRGERPMLATARSRSGKRPLAVPSALIFRRGRFDALIVL